MATAILSKGKSTLKILSLNEEHKEFYIDDVYIGTVNHDEHGWSGMESAESLVVSMAEQLGLNIVHAEED